MNNKLRRRKTTNKNSKYPRKVSEKAKTIVHKKPARQTQLTQTYYVRSDNLRRVTNNL